MDTQASEPRTLPRFAPALALLGLAIVVNYVDRGNLSLAAPLLKDEFRLSASQLGILLSAFFWSYTALQFVVGWIADRFDVNLVIATGYLIWSLATAGTGFVHGFAMLLVMRCLLGVGESVIFPACSKVLAIHLPEHSRGLANGVIVGGIGTGQVVGTLGAGLLITHCGWRPIFIAIGLVSLLWLPAWMKWMPRAADAVHYAGQRVATIAQILRQGSFWGVSAGHFCGNYVLYFLVTWLPFYLVHERHLSMSTMVTTVSCYFLADATSALLTGVMADGFIRRGFSPTVVRKSAMSIGYTGAAVCVACVAVASPHTYVLWLVAAGLGRGMGGSGTYAFPQTLAGPRTCGKWTGLQNGLANLAGVVGPTLTGFIVDWTGNFLTAFAIAAMAALTAALSWTLLVGPLEEIRWTRKPEATQAATSTA